MFMQLAFMAWVRFFMLQVTLATTGASDLHKAAGWIGAAFDACSAYPRRADLVPDDAQRRSAAILNYAYFMVMNLMALWPSLH